MDRKIYKIVSIMCKFKNIYIYIYIYIFENILSVSVNLKNYRKLFIYLTCLITLTDVIVGALADNRIAKQDTKSILKTIKKFFFKPCRNFIDKTSQFAKLIYY